MRKTILKNIKKDNFIAWKGKDIQTWIDYTVREKFDGDPLPDNYCRLVVNDFWTTSIYWNIKINKPSQDEILRHANEKIKLDLKLGGVLSGKKFIKFNALSTDLQSELLKEYRRYVYKKNEEFSDAFLDQNS